MDIIQINKFSYFHNNQNVFFCKTDYVNQVFNTIKNTKNNVILITGNSDYCITDDIVQNIPSNIVKWFCQNRLSDHNILEAIPLGIDNSIQCAVDGHGHVWPHATLHVQLLSKTYNVIPSKLIYANFSLETNSTRSIIDNMCRNLKYVTCNIVNKHTESNKRSYELYIKEILNHKAVLCPQGNDIGDNHRIYETLYLNRIPITFNKQQYKYLHHRFPTILIENFNQLKDENWLIEKINWAENKMNKTLLDYTYWEDQIKSIIEKI